MSKRPSSRRFHLSLAALLAALFVSAPALALQPGDPAPGFSLVGSDGQRHELKKILAEGRGVVLAWFPKAFTGG